jgi:hypothetical protein
VDEELGVERERVERRGHRTLERVLDRDDPARRLATLDGAEHLEHVTAGERATVSSPRCSMRAAVSVNVPSGPR